MEGIHEERDQLPPGPLFISPNLLLEKGVQQLKVEGASPTAEFMEKDEALVASDAGCEVELACPPPATHELPTEQALAEEERKEEAAKQAGAEEIDEKALLALLEDEEREMRIFYEIGLIRKFDRASINVRRECWYLMDAEWLNQWAAYVKGKVKVRPGPVSNLTLWEAGEGGERQLRKGLRVGRDYRAVNPITYYSYVVLYGRDDAPDICRFTVDAYALDVPLARRKDMALRGMVTARIEVGKMRAKLRHLFPLPSPGGGGGDGNPEDGAEENRRCCCCVVSRGRAECLLFWLYSFCHRLSPWYKDHRDEGRWEEELFEEEEDAEGEGVWARVVRGRRGDQTRLLTQEKKGRW